MNKSRLLIFTLLSFVLTGLFSSPLSAANEFDHSQWNTLLKQHVLPLNGGQASQVDYQGFVDDKASLDAYLKTLENVSQSEFDDWSKDNQLAFLINAYNAWTVDLILTEWPDLDSIKDLGRFFSSPWSKSFIPLLGKTRSLDDIEHNLIRGSDRYQDPRIHFAVNCASIGCPALRNEAYKGQSLDTQLNEQTQLFLQDRSRNRINDNQLELSSIFKWYREDFEKGWQGYSSLEQFLADHATDLSLSPEALQILKDKDMTIRFLDYDWALNRTL
ncbi:DUF547 domain-containing protein [Marinomonas rhizomae]|uniref:Uncharacterized protein DUF547 n=1 Tax=Marinomonas rhizomae TaxID=491948 RepID=A0A366JCC3_9GAMM|nr:DUF547 domain-containing protein [Marinomonas rhizomae]RBP83935.1 uncharacterized protein DUF547 [Marinomonas rhizomae]RNF73362.1 DUF547 domain-containing protein [Marinomonas rhizomae]